MRIIEKPLGELTPYENNPRRIGEDAVNAVAESIRQFGFRVPIVIDADGVIICGHTRYQAAQSLGLASVPCVVADDLTPEQVKAFRLADNKTAELTAWDFSALEAELDALSDAFDMGAFGFDLDAAFSGTPDFGGVESAADFQERDEAKGSMKEKYLVPPFSVIYGNKPDWLERKRAWIAKGIRSELGRGGGLVFHISEWMETQSSVKGAS